jgi:hypothetical protein
MTSDGGAPAAGERRLSPWAFVLTFGVVSLFADMVYDGERSLIGPYRSTLGAVAGTGELIGYTLRVGSADLAGYLVTVGTVPLLGATGSLPLTMFLYAGERLGKAVRAPAKDTLLSFA